MQALGSAGEYYQCLAAGSRLAIPITMEVGQVDFNIGVELETKDSGSDRDDAEMERTAFAADLALGKKFEFNAVASRFGKELPYTPGESAVRSAFLVYGSGDKVGPN